MEGKEPLFKIEIIKVNRFCWAELTARGSKFCVQCNEEDLQQLRELAHIKSVKLARVKQKVSDIENKKQRKEGQGTS